MKKYEEDNSESQLQSQLLAQIDDQIAKIQQHIADFTKSGPKTLWQLSTTGTAAETRTGIQKESPDAKDQRSCKALQTLTNHTPAESRRNHERVQLSTKNSCAESCFKTSPTPLASCKTKSQSTENRDEGGAESRSRLGESNTVTTITLQIFRILNKKAS
ncbi:Hypothetical_protein [Hexamita inflata]|uniref:Hypothetical_protein n=1 Tax=Hexamita inflata TaxID=28002 RepID=A0AA86RC41_9EUKA|nr:Hypothetical protein HINF_LOCUS57997 [Hexamita inflata]